ncbi:MAG: cysteine--tRNA ligase [Candidatus Staskawiczbacteria bacterium RIFCSPHIGHO2_02_FULL_34_9]|uniref:Cysteine--tRNA ligase n=1 Tax=Candidatus Staskawiczbacteria bacterium RIFCSPHIGHO2_02_FULL_34_9 TaxID=1802206 RepID=A0A1G2HYH7_9BACT|nr:MAG: cysteine--tRNA ligase [Candidatus Staskawiczbacteria bacterium RIFCSPHIGHO2_02_FULL_34_9]
MNQLKIYNTLSRKKEDFKPFKKKKINIFVCGPTVYDFSHIGHARTNIVFDSLVKYFKKQGFKVFYLQNITDIDDKIIQRAREKGVTPKDLAEAFTKEHLKDMKDLGINSVDKYAKATSYIKEIINQTKRLIDKGYAYKLDDGIYFDISKFESYGKLSGRTSLQAEDSISRIDYSKNKKNRGDFCLWKLNDNSDEPSWPSPFGKGRPGWHIEDTAITEKFFGPQYDIHGGGIDLIFPHHEAEVTQMESISGKSPMAKYWMHIGFLTISGQKMSKSLDNFVTISDFLKRHTYRHLRFLIVKNLWRSPMNYSEVILMDAKAGVERVEGFLAKIKNIKQYSKGDAKVTLEIKKLKDNFYENLADDFNTPKAFATIFEFIKKINAFLDKNLLSKSQATSTYRFFEEINDIFDFIDFKKLSKIKFPKEVEDLVKEREKYRKLSEWQKADMARIEIEKNGFIVEDTKEGPLLRKKE